MTDLKPVFSKDKFSSAFKISGAVLARGRFARIKKCTSEGESRPDACVKEVMKSRAGKSLQNDINHEVTILQMAKSQSVNNILRIIDAFDENRYYLVLEFCAGGELFDHLPYGKEYTPKTHTITNFKRAMLQIATGLSWMHKNDILHLDLKPQNILLKTSDFTSTDFVIADFGLSRFLENGKENIQLMVGTPGYCSPEVLKFQTLTLAADIFSLGCCFYVMLTGEMPFDGDDGDKKDFAQQTFTNIEFMKESYSNEIFHRDKQAKILVENMLRKNPSERVSIEKVIDDKFFGDKTKCESTSSKTTIDCSFSYNSDSSKEEKYQNSDECFLTDDDNKFNNGYSKSDFRSPLKPLNRRLSKRPAEEMLPTSPDILPDSKKPVLLIYYYFAPVPFSSNFVDNFSSITSAI